MTINSKNVYELHGKIETKQEQQDNNSEIFANQE